MSEHITHTALLDDSFRLLEASDQIWPELKRVAREQRDFARLGCITRYGDRFTVGLLSQVRSGWEQRAERMLEPKLAFVLAWLTHRAADRQMKPVFREFHPPETRKVSPTECSVYHDAYIFHEVYNHGHDNPFHAAMMERGLESLPAGRKLNVAEVEELFRVVLQRSLLELHTLIPDTDDIDGWLEKLATLQQRYYVDLERYAKAISDPDPDKVRRYLVEGRFYDANDPLIAAARQVQRGAAPGPIAEAATREHVSHYGQALQMSHYGQALQMSYGYLVAASAFLTSDMPEHELARRLKIGELGRDGKFV